MGGFSPATFARNVQATQLVHALDLPEAGLTCCALLGCRTPDTVLEAACLTELAVGRDAALPEIRVEAATGHRRRSAPAHQPALDERPAAAHTHARAHGR
jgi:hypothetical protein